MNGFDEIDVTAKFVAQLHCCVNRALRVILHWPLLDVGVLYPRGRSAVSHRLQRGVVERYAAQQLREEAHLAGEWLIRPRQPALRHQACEHRVPHRVRRRRALPHGKLARPCLPHGRMRHAGNRNRMLYLLCRLPQHPARAARRADARIDDMVPLVRPHARRVAQVHRHLVSRSRRREYVPHRLAAPLAQRHDAGNHIARMQRLQRQICIVEIQIPGHQPVGECRRLRRNPHRRAPDRRPARLLEVISVSARRLRCVLRKRRHAHPDAVQYPPLHLMRRLRRHILIPQPLRVFREHPAESV